MVSVALVAACDARARGQLAGQHRRDVYSTDAQGCLRHAAIIRIQNSEMFPHLANQNVSAKVLFAIYIFRGKGLLQTGKVETRYWQYYKVHYYSYVHC